MSRTKNDNKSLTVTDVIEMKEDSITRRDFLMKGAVGASVLFVASDPGSFAASSEVSGEVKKTFKDIYPDDAFSRPFEDRWDIFDMRLCAPQGDVKFRADHYVENEILLIEEDGGKKTLWRLNPRDTDSAGLSIPRLIRHRPREISFRVLNRSEHPISFVLHYSEQFWRPQKEVDSRSWVLGDAQEVGPGEAKILVFDFTNAHPSKEGKRTEPEFPGNITIGVQNLQRDTLSALLFSDLTFYFSPAKDITSKHIDCSKTFRAGDKEDFHVEATGTFDDRILDLEVRREPRVIWRIRLTEEETQALKKGTAKITRQTPWYLPPGKSTIGLVADGYRAQGAEATTEIVNATKAKLPQAEVRSHNGAPTFFFDGKPHGWQGYSTADYQPGSVSEFGKSGADVLCVPVDPGRRLNLSTTNPTWIDWHKYDFSSVDELVCLSLQANPDALVFLRLHFALPAFWDQAHEDQLVRIMTEKGPLIWEEENTTRVGSFASHVWLRDQTRALRELLRYCKKQPWACRLAGVWINGGVTEEWFAYGCNDGFFSDYSQPNEQRFREWLNRNEFPLPSDIPMPSARQCPGYDLYTDTEEHRRAAAYNQYYSDLTAETIGHFAKVVKEETKGRCLAGTYYGYVIQLAGESRQTLAAHGALRKALDDPNIDFIGGIPLHHFRHLNGYSVFVSATRSILASGKLYCNENDLFSWIHPAHWNTPYDPNDPRNAAISMHRRELANEIVNGCVGQWFSLQPSWHHDAALQAEFGKQIRLQSETLALDRTPVEEIAFVVDDVTWASTPPETRLLGLTNIQLLYRLARTGAPLGVWLFSDLDKLPERIRFIVIASASAPRGEDLSKLQSLLKKGGRTFLIVGAPGFINPTTYQCDLKRVADILGIPIRLQDEPGLSGKMNLSEDGTPITDVEDHPRPRFFVDEPGLLRYSDGPTAGRQKDLPNGGQLIWCGMPPLSSQLLRRWIERAGVRCYAPVEYSVYASKELVSVTSPIPCDPVTTLTWPKSAQVADLFDGWEGQGVTIRCPFNGGQTRLFRVS